VSAHASIPEPSEVATLRLQKGRVDSLVLFGLAALLLFEPLAFGATEPWSIFVMEASAALLFVIWMIGQISTRQFAVTGNPLFAPMGAFAALVALQLATGISGYRQATWSASLLYLAYGLQCFLLVQTLKRTAQVRTLANIFCVYGSAVALFAIVQGMASNGKLYWVRAPRYAGWIYGPYVNHNNYAGLMELLLPIPLVIALSHFVRGARKAMAGAAAAIMTTSVFLSGSRGGMAAVGLEIAFLIAAVAYRERKGEARKPRGSAMVLAVFLILVVGLITWLGGGKLAERMASIQTETRTELSGGTRLEIDRDTLQMFRARPLLGWGLGVFPEVFPQFQTFYSTFFVNDAHNDYVQFLAEMGIAGSLTGLWFLFLTYRRACSKLANWPADTNGTLALAAIVGVTGMLLHSFVDFNLQIPANAAIFFVLCTAAAMEVRFALTRRTLRRSGDIIPLAPDAATGQF